MSEPVGTAQAAGSPAGGSESTRSLSAGTGENSYQILAAAINAQVELLYHTSVTLLQYPSQGNFLWYYENANQVFNNGTYGYVSARVSAGDEPGLAQLSGPGGFPNAYAQLLSQIRYLLSSTDQASHNQSATDQASYGNQLLSQLKQATYQPTALNGGMLTVDPDTGAISPGYQVGYGINSPLATIQAGLQSGQPIITVNVPAPNGATATISYPGCQMVAVQASAWQQATNTGWFYADPIADAYRNGTQDVTGYRFTTAPSYNPGPLSSGGDLGYLVSLLISNPPTVSLSMPSAALLADTAPTEVVADFFDSLSLLNLGQAADVHYYGMTAVTPTSLNMLSVAAPTTVSASVPLLQQSAYVVGACLDFPATG